MKVSLNSEALKTKASKLAENVLRKKFAVLGPIAVGWVTEKIRQNKSIVTGNLLNSITFSIENKEGFSPNNKPLSAGGPLTLRVGTTVVYAPRVEFGFVGEDSLGRFYKQPPKPFLRPALLEHESTIIKIISK